MVNALNFLGVKSFDSKVSPRTMPKTVNVYFYFAVNADCARGELCISPADRAHFVSGAYGCQSVFYMFPRTMEKWSMFSTFSVSRTMEKMVNVFSVTYSQENVEAQRLSHFQK